MTVFALAYKLEIIAFSLKKEEKKCLLWLIDLELKAFFSLFKAQKPIYLKLG